MSLLREHRPVEEAREGGAGRGRTLRSANRDIKETTSKGRLVCSDKHSEPIEHPRRPNGTEDHDQPEALGLVLGRVR